MFECLENCFGVSQNVPLKSVHVNGTFCDSLGEVVIRQSWMNESASTISGKYVFSLDSNAVVSSLKISIGSDSWIGVVKEKSVAKSEYSEAVLDGIQSTLLEKLSSTDCSVSVGPIELRQQVKIEFSYLTRTEVQNDGSYRFVLPTNIAPKYNSGTSNATDMNLSEQLDSIPYASNPGYLFDVDIKWSSGSSIQEVVSPTNEIQTSVIAANSIRVQSTTAPANGGFTLCLKTESTTAANSYESPEDQSTYLYIHNRIPSEVTVAVPRKITIMLDRSGSMEGKKIAQAVSAIRSFLELLDPDMSFVNIVGFGDGYQALWSAPMSLALNGIKNTCLAHLDTVSANMEGTELLRCLSDVLNGDLNSFECPSFVSECEGLEHIVVLLTDGQVDNMNEILNMLKQNTVKCRVMTIGIGTDADRKLVQRIAEVMNGISRMLVDELDLTAALAVIIDYIHTQYYVNVHVDQCEVVQCSKVLYPAHPLDMFLRLTPKQLIEVSSSDLTITAEDPVYQCKQSWSIPVDQCEQSSNLIEKLYVNAVICQLEEQLCPDVERIVALSVKYGLMNEHTSFLIVSDNKVDMSSASLVNVQVPHYGHHPPVDTPLEKSLIKSKRSMERYQRRYSRVREGWLADIQW